MLVHFTMYQHNNYCWHLMIYGPVSTGSLLRQWCTRFLLGFWNFNLKCCEILKNCFKLYQIILNWDLIHAIFQVPPLIFQVFSNREAVNRNPEASSLLNWPHDNPNWKINAHPTTYNLWFFFLNVQMQWPSNNLYEKLDILQWNPNEW